MAPITLDKKIIKPSKSIRLLGVYLYQSLTYKAHINALDTKILVLLNALRLITSSTWESSLIVVRTIYKEAIRLVITYGA